MTNLEQLRKEIKESLEESIKIWSKQGRTEEQIYGVQNFTTGEGQAFLDQAISRAYEAGKDGGESGDKL